MNNIRRWDAASPDVVQNWVSEVKSINEDLRTQGEALRARARDLEQNNDYASRYLNLVETNIVGEGDQAAKQGAHQTRQARQPRQPNHRAGIYRLDKRQELLA